MLYTVIGFFAGLIFGILIGSIIHAIDDRFQVIGGIICVLVIGIGIGMGILTDYTRFMNNKYLPF